MVIERKCFIIVLAVSTSPPEEQQQLHSAALFPPLTLNRLTQPRERCLKGTTIQPGSNKSEQPKEEVVHETMEET